MNLNKIIAAGYLFEDPAIKYSPEGTVTVRFKIGSSETWRDRESGENHEHVERFIAVKHNASPAFGDFVKNNIKKGTNVYVEGRNRTRKWRPKGSDKDVYITEIIINSGIEAFQKIGDPKGATALPQRQANAPTSVKPKARPQPQQNSIEDSQAFEQHNASNPSPMNYSGSTEDKYADVFSDLRSPNIR